jgi:transcriptional regulator with AAA-type ATPase domain
LSRIFVGTFHSEIQHRKDKKEQLKFSKIVSERSLTINQTISMLHKHFTTEKRNGLSALLRAEVKKKDIARYLGKHRTTVWRELTKDQ